MQPLGDRDDQVVGTERAHLRVLQAIDVHKGEHDHFAVRARVERALEQVEHLVVVRQAGELVGFGRLHRLCLGLKQFAAGAAQLPEGDPGEQHEGNEACDRGKRRRLE
jgi:hypothetical protein